MPGRSCGLVWMSSGGKPSHMVGCCVHEGSLVWDYVGIEDVVLVDSSSLFLEALTFVRVPSGGSIFHDRADKGGVRLGLSLSVTSR